MKTITKERKSKKGLGEWVTVAEICQETGLSRQSIHDRIHALQLDVRRNKRGPYGMLFLTPDQASRVRMAVKSSGQFQGPATIASLSSPSSQKWIEALESGTAKNAVDLVRSFGAMPTDAEATFQWWKRNASVLVIRSEQLDRLIVMFDTVIHTDDELIAVAQMIVESTSAQRTVCMMCQKRPSVVCEGCALRKRLQTRPAAPAKDPSPVERELIAIESRRKQDEEKLHRLKEKTAALNGIDSDEGAA
jgi:hypothetical protein